MTAATSGILTLGKRFLYKLTVSDLKVVTSFPPPGPSPHGLAWDGESLWSADVQSDRHYKVSPDTGEILAEFPSPGTRPHGIAWDGTTLWSADTDTHIISQIDPNSGEVLDSFECPGEPHGLTWDGAHISGTAMTRRKTICKIALERT